MSLKEVCFLSLGELYSVILHKVTKYIYTFFNVDIFLREISKVYLVHDHSV